MRTTDEDHYEAVQYAWQLLQEKDLIYSSKHEGWYAVSDETFYPASAVHLIIEPWSGRKHMASIETGKEVEWNVPQRIKVQKWVAGNYTKGAPEKPVSGFVCECMPLNAPDAHGAFVYSPSPNDHFAF